MSDQRDRENLSKKMALKPHVYVSAKQHVEGLSALLASTKTLVWSATLLFMQVSISISIIAGVLVVQQEPAGLPNECPENNSAS